MRALKRTQSRPSRFTSSLYRYLASYLLLLLLPCCLGLGVYTTYSGELLEQLHEANQSRLQIAMSEVDNVIDQMYHASFQLYNSVRFRQYMARKSGYNTYELVSMLAAYAERAPFVADFGLWDGEAGKILTAGGSYRDDVYFERLFPLRDRAEALAALAASGGMRLMEFSCANGEMLYLYLYPFTSFFLKSSYDQGALFFIMREADLWAYVRRLTGEGGDLRLSIGAPDEHAPRKGAMLYTAISSGNDLSISLKLDEDSLPKRIRQGRIGFSVGMALTILISVALSVLMSFQHIKPIRRLLAEMLPYRTSELAPGSDELRRISDILEDIRDVSDQMGKRMNEQKNTLRQQALTLLLTGPADDATMESLRRIGIAVDGRFCFATLIYSIRAEGPHANDDILNLLENTAYPAQYEVYPIELESLGAIAAVVSLPEPNDDRRRVFCELVASAAAHAGLRAGINAGGLVEGMRSVGTSLSEALSLSMDSEGARLFRPSQQMPPVWQSRSSKAVACLIQALKSGSAEGAQVSLDNALDEIDGPLNSPLMRRCAYYDLLNAILGQCAALNAELSLEGLEKALATMRRDEYRDALREALREVCSRVHQDALSASSRRADELVQYVMDHYADYALCVDQLMTRFGISANQISRIFRQKTGYGFREYLIYMRMLRAKELLLNTSLSVSEICGRAGYGNVSYFIKTFKTYYGLTPAQYKRQSENSGAVGSL